MGLRSQALMSNIPSSFFRGFSSSIEKQLFAGGYTFLRWISNTNKKRGEPHFIPDTLVDRCHEGVVHVLSKASRSAIGAQAEQSRNNISTVDRTSSVHQLRLHILQVLRSATRAFSESGAVVDMDTRAFPYLYRHVRRSNVCPLSLSICKRPAFSLLCNALRHCILCSVDILEGGHYLPSGGERRGRYDFIYKNNTLSV